MKLSSTLSFSVGFLALLAQANPIAEPEASVEGSLEKRDVLCKVARGAVCRWGPGESSFVRRRDVSTSDTFGVKCLIKNGAGTTWDWVPGWGCWVSARDTRSADGRSSCESGVPTCR